MKTNVHISLLIRRFAISTLTGLAILAPHACGAVCFSELNTNGLIASTSFELWNSDNEIEAPVPFLETVELPPTDFPVSVMKHYAAVSFPEGAVLDRNPNV